MNSNKLSLLFSILVLTIMFCSKGKEGKKNEMSHNKLTEQELKDIDSKKLLYKTSVQGKVVDITDGLMFFHGSNGKEYTDIFSFITTNTSELLDIKELLKKPINIKYYLEHTEMVDPISGEKILLLVSNKVSLGYRDSIDLSKYKKVVIGHEISYIHGRDNLIKNINLSSSEKLSKNKVVGKISASFPKSKISYTSNSCSSGGKGAISCSINDWMTGCSITCSDGYYACCKSDSNVCACIPEVGGMALPLVPAHMPK